MTIPAIVKKYESFLKSMVKFVTPIEKRREQKKSIEACECISPKSPVKMLKAIKANPAPVRRRPLRFARGRVFPPNSWFKTLVNPRPKNVNRVPLIARPKLKTNATGPK